MSSTVISRLLGKNELDREMLLDAVSKFRVSTPQSLIDTDYEYGLQSAKWETLQMVNNVPTFFSRNGDTSIPISDVQTREGVEYVYVTTPTPHMLADGQPILVQGLKTPYAEGYFTVDRVLSPTSFAYRSPRPQQLTDSVYDIHTTSIFPGQYYEGTGLFQQQIRWVHTDSNAPSQLQVETLHPHGFATGTQFMLTNSVGKRILNFDANAISESNFTIPGHNLVDGSVVRYSKFINGTALSGITDNAEYYVFGTTANNFYLSPSSNLDTVVTISSPSGTFHQLITTDDATDGSFYPVVGVPSPTSFLLQAPFQISPTVFTINPAENVNLYHSMIEFRQLHKTRTGAQVHYRTQGGTPFGGLTDDTTYYVIRQDTSNIQLATSYSNAMNNIYVQMASSTLGSGTSHTFTLHGVDGEVVGTGTVTLSNASPVVLGTNVNFLSMTRPNEKMLIEIPHTTSSYPFTVQDTTVTLEADVSTQTPIRFHGTATSGLVNQCIYYARNLTQNTCSLHPTPLDAMNDTNVISPVNAIGTLEVRTEYTTIWEPMVTDVVSSNRVILDTPSSVTASNMSILTRTGVYPFMDGLVLHRAVDGGVELIPSNNADAQVIRQTRRYFRYQPGKGMQCSLSVNFNAPVDVSYASYNPDTNKVTVHTRKPHRMSTGIQIIMDNHEPDWKNTRWTGPVTITVTSITSFEYVPAMAPSPIVCPGLPIFSVTSWENSHIRAGLYDDQNGMFLEYDGATMYAVRRDSVTQLSGNASVTYGSPVVTGVQNTTYTTQIAQGSHVVIKGMSYKVVHVENDTCFYVQPPFRGASDSFCEISLTTDTRTPQHQWNIDKCDGSGPSGLLNISKIQMIYFDYSWYGAGAIRFGFKDPQGEVRYVHKYIHNNSHTTAYFRAGNLPTRYEVCNIGKPTWVPPLLHWGTAVIMDGNYDEDKSYQYTASGNVLSFANGDQVTLSCTIPSLQPHSVYDPFARSTIHAYRLVAGANTFASVQNMRPQTLVTGPLLPVGTYTVGVPQRDPTDITKAIIFVSQPPSATDLAPTSYTFGDTADLIPPCIPIVSIRLAPAADTSLGGLLGTRELINRIRLQVRSMDITVSKDTEVRLLLNGINDNKNWIAATSPSLCQVVLHNKKDQVEMGTTIFSYRASAGTSACDIQKLEPLGNSIMGGNGVYPDGTDVLTVVATCIDTTGVTTTNPYTVSSRISWTEA